MQRATQLSFLEPVQEKPSIVNVASVPQRSLFRYPGGKTWLVPYIRRWLTSQPVPLNKFFEPFAGGAIVGLTVAFEKLASHVTLVELDEQVAAVWQTILRGEAEWLAQRIISFEMSPERVDEELAKSAESTDELAFQTILKNRVNRGGILAPGAGKVKQGENGKGLASRWYPSTLRQRILDIIAIRERISFLQADGISVIEQHVQQPATAFFIDPPYTAGGKRAGSRLYRYSEIDHQKLFHVVSEVKGDFLMTYDDAPEVRALARQYNFDTQLVPMKSTHHAEMFELLIGRNLDWAR
ncbi:MAG: DNA adenine methylase [Caldilineaceae bacterium]